MTRHCIPTESSSSSSPPWLLALLRSDASLSVQLTLIVLHALFWSTIIPVVGLKVVKPFLLKKPWLEQFISYNQRTLAKSFFIHLSRDATLNFICPFQVVMLQHTVGACLCLPALLGCDSSIAVPLACHGALCEAGYELGDVLTRVYAFITDKTKARQVNPPSLLIIMMIHHTMGLSMVLPMNLWYPDLYWYHEATFLLQGAAAAALWLQSFGYTLDVKKRHELLQLRLALLTSWAIVCYSRGGRFIYVAFQIFSFFANSGAFAMCRGVLLSAGLMSIVNLLFISDLTSKLLKFFSATPNVAAPPLESTSSSKQVVWADPTTEVLDDSKLVPMAYLEDLAEDSLSALSPRSPLFPAKFAPLSLPVAQKAWARVRGAVYMGVVKLQ